MIKWTHRTLRTGNNKEIIKNFKFLFNELFWPELVSMVKGKLSCNRSKSYSAKNRKQNIFLEESLEKVTFVAWKRQPTDTDLVVVDTCGHRVETEWLCTGTQQVAGAGIGTIIVVIVRGNLT